MWKVNPAYRTKGWLDQEVAAKRSKPIVRRLVTYKLRVRGKAYIWPVGNTFYEKTRTPTAQR